MDPQMDTFLLEIFNLSSPPPISSAQEMKDLAKPVATGDIGQTVQNLY